MTVLGIIVNAVHMQLLGRAPVRLSDTVIMIALATSHDAVAAARNNARSARRSARERLPWPQLDKMPLIEATRANSYAFDANLARDKAQTEVDAARQGVRLAKGALP